MKKYLKKSFSTFLALLMVFTSLVFVAPEIAPEAEAAANSYSYEVWVHRDKNGGGSESTSHIKVYYKVVNNNGTLTTNDSTYVKTHDLSSFSSSTSTKYSGTAGGWPYKIEVYTADDDSNNEDLILDKIVVAGKTVLEGGWTVGQGGSRLFEYSYATADYGEPTVFDWPEPKLTTYKWNDSVATVERVTVPYSGTAYSGYTPTVTMKDNYNIDWPGTPNLTLRAGADVASTIVQNQTGISLNSTGSGVSQQTRLAIQNGAKGYVAQHSAEGEHHTSLFIHSSVAGQYLDAKEIEVHNIIYDANFENLFSLNDWLANAPVSSFAGNAAIDQLNGKLTLENTATSEQTLKSSCQIPVQPGKTYTLEYVRGEAANTDVYVFFNDSTDSSIFNDSQNRLSKAEAGLATKDFVIPNGVSYVTIRFDANYNGSSGNKFTFSNIKFYEKERREGFAIDGDRVPVYGYEEIGGLPTPTKAGYTFDGWYTGVDGTGTKLTETTYIVNNVSYFAKWIPVTNIAKFYTYDGQLHATVSGLYNQKISSFTPAAPASFTNEAGTWVFFRWVNKETGAPLGNEVFNSINEGDLVAEYQAEYKRQGDLTTYTATFLNPADSSYSKTASGKFNTSVATPAATPVKASEKINGVDAYDYVFIGWSLEEEGEVVLNPGDSVRILEDVTYYAQFEQRLAQHTISTVYGTTDGGANAGGLDYPAGYGEWVELPNAAEWRDQTNSYIFSHWVDSKGNTYEPVGNKTSVRVLGPETYTAVYDAEPVRYHAYFYNGTEMVEDQILGYNDYVTVPAEDPTKDRVGNTTYEFDGWYLYDTETGVWGEKLEDNKFVITGDDYAFYAKYNEIKWSQITFLKDADSSYEIIGEMKEYKWGDVVTVPEGPAKESTAQYDFTFTGWTEYVNGEIGQFHAAGTEITTPEVDTVYIATYEATTRKYTVTFYGEDGETVIGDPQTVEFGSKPVAPADPTKESTLRYEYDFDGWFDGVRVYAGTELPAVEGDTEYKAIFTGRDIYYQVHWLTPTADGTISTYTTVNYTYNRIVSMPASSPDLENDETQTGKTWGFAGWYVSDASGNLLDAEGNIIAADEYKEKGVAFVKGTHITGTLYYIAVFDFIPNPYKVNVYNEEGTLLKTYSGVYGAVVNVTNFTKASISAKHYVLEGFATSADGDVVYDVDTITEDGVTVLDTVTAITVTGNMNLYLVYGEDSHSYDADGDGNVDADAEWTIDKDASYAEAGEKHIICSECKFRQDGTIDKLVDTTAPVGQVAIGGNNWTNEFTPDENGEPIWNSEEVAYVRADAIISVLTTDVGNGIKSIKYTWSDGATHTYEVENEFDTEVNYNFLIPENFAGKYIDVIVIDYVGKPYKIQTATLQLDTAAPVITTHIDCLWFGFNVEDDHEIDTIKVTNAAGEELEYTYMVDKDDEGNVRQEGYVVGDVEEKTALAAGEYTITVTDKAGNVSEEEIYVVGEHTASDWIVDTEAACLVDGAKHTECTACKKVLETAKIDALTHDMNDEEWVAANTVWEVTTEPACEQAGEKTLFCVKCREELMKAPVDALEHNYEAVVTDPTCEDAGYTTYTCSLCGDYYEDDYVQALGHDMKIVEEVAADCEKAGYTVYECANGCGKKETVAGDPALNHPEDQRETITIESECTGSTLTKIVCKLCGEVLEQEGDLEGHTWTEKKFAATCTADAYTVKSCTKCDAEVTIVDRLTKLGHAWDENYTVDVAPDCTKEGSESIHCSVCDETKNERTVPALGHELVLDETTKKIATCNTDGYEKYECSRCDYTEEKVIPATGEHVFTIFDTDASKAADCVTDGLEVYKCAGKDCTETKEVVIPALGHEKGDKISETAGDCQTLGTATYECTRCDETITETTSYGAHEASDVLVKTIKAATCTAAGDGVFKCKNCDATVIVNGGIAALGHDYKEVVTPATCVDDGYTTKTCSRCGDVQVIPGDEATGEHTWNTEYTIITEADCDTNGSKAIYCSICNELKTGSETIIPATGHTESDWITDTKADCTNDGSKHTECEICGETIKTETIPSKGGHVQGALVKTNTPATCSKVGEGVYKCTVCGETYIDVIAIDANNHSYSEWVTVDATCTAEGYKTKTCTNKDADGKACAAEIKKTLPALGHNYKFVKEEVVEQNGNFVTKKTYQCTVCKGTKTETVETTAYIVTIVDTYNSKTSTIILKNGAQLRKSDLPEIAIPDDVAQTTYVLTWTDASGNALKLPMDITGNTTIYANVEAKTKTYTVSFVNNAGKIISSAEYVYGATVVVPEDQVLLNSTFLGWSDGVNTYAAENIPAVTGDVTYSAKFQANPGIKTYYVTFKNETGMKTIFTQTVTEGGKATTPDIVPTKANNSVYHYVFAGWYTATEGGSAYNFNTTVTANVTVYARFTAVKHSANASSVSTPADCANPASVEYTCNVCGYEWITYTDPATGHSYKEIKRETTADGKVMVTYACSVCGDTWTKTVTQGMADSNAIIVTVTDNNGNPVAGASVAIYIGDLKVTAAVTDAKGKAYFAKEVVADGSYRVNVTKDGYDNLSGTLVVKDGKGSVKLNSFSLKICRCSCHANNFFGKVKRWFTNLLRSIFKGYTCCDCGNCGYVY